MKKLTAALCALMALLSFGRAEAAYSQQNIYNSLSSALVWMDKNAPPLRNPDSAASDYYIMALARMNRPYDFAAFARLADSRRISTRRDGRRLVMAETACGYAVSEDTVRAYTYDTDNFDNLTDLAGAIITLDCGGYAVKDKEKSKDDLICGLLSAQHSDGSFSSDCYTTALSVIALAPYNGLNYNTGSGNDTVSYSVESALLNAARFLEGAKSADFGYPTVRASAFVIIALDSIGIDADNDAAFSDGSGSPVSSLISKQQPDGSFNSSAEDTAFALCALTSRLRAMQGKSSFFRFRDKDELSLDAAKSGNSENLSGDGHTSPSAAVSQTPEKAVSGTFATPVPAPKRSNSGGKHAVLMLSLIFTTVIFIGACAYIVIRFKFGKSRFFDKNS